MTDRSDINSSLRWIGVSARYWAANDTYVTVDFSGLFYFHL